MKVGFQLTINLFISGESFRQPQNLRACLDLMSKIYTLASAGDWTTVIQPVASRFSDRIIPSVILISNVFKLMTILHKNFFKSAQPS
jgi:hypothetical protein